MTAQQVTDIWQELQGWLDARMSPNPIEQMVVLLLIIGGWMQAMGAEGEGSQSDRMMSDEQLEQLVWALSPQDVSALFGKAAGMMIQRMQTEEEQPRGTA